MCRTHSRLRSTLTLATAIWVLGVGVPSAVFAQSLDEEIERLLGGDCGSLGLIEATDEFVGPNLGVVCATNAAVSVGSTGGGSASTQSAGASTKSKRALQRVEEERDADATFDAASFINIFDIDGLGLWTSIAAGERDREVTRFEDGYESDIFAVTVGTDYRINELVFLGGAFDYRHADADFEGGGGFDTDSYGGVVYGSLTPNSVISIDATVGFSSHEYQVERNVRFEEFGDGSLNAVLEGTASSESDGWQVNASGVVGYSHVIDSISVEPRVGVNYIYTDIGSFQETGGTGLELKYQGFKRKSLQSVVGLGGSVVASTRFAVLIPRFDFDWIHEFEDDKLRRKANFIEDLRDDPLVFQFKTEKPDRDFFRLGFGVSLALPRGVQAFVQYRTVLRHRYFHEQIFTVGARFEPSRLISRR